MKLVTILKYLVLALITSLAFYEFILCCIVFFLYYIYQVLCLGEHVNDAIMAMDISWCFSVVYFILHGRKSNEKKRRGIKKKDSFLDRFVWSCLKTFGVFFPLFLLFLVTDPLEKIDNYALHKSHKQIGVVYKKYTTWEIAKRLDKSHYLKIGISSSQTKKHKLNGDKVPIFESMHVGDTVILRVSDKYPRVNKVLNWHPTHDEIEKYKTPVKLIEK